MATSITQAELDLVPEWPAWYTPSISAESIHRTRFQGQLWQVEINSGTVRGWVIVRRVNPRNYYSMPQYAHRVVETLPGFDACQAKAEEVKQRLPAYATEMVL